MSHSARNALIAGGVVLLHVAFLWALQTGLLRRAAEVVVPVELLSAILTPPAPEAPPVPQPPAQEPIQEQVVRKSTPVPRPAPQPVAVPDRTPAPSAPVGTSESQPPAPPITAPMTSAATPMPASTTPPAPRVELPISNADYLQNPPPAYPRMSFKLGEEGTTVVRVLIGTDGRAQDAQIAKSSGFTRLDQAAEATARSWKYLPGKRGGVPEAMWVNVPIKWEIKKE